MENTQSGQFMKEGAHSYQKWGIEPYISALSRPPLFS